MHYVASLSITTISELSWFRAVKDRLRSFVCSIGRSIGFLDSAESVTPSPLAPYHLHPTPKEFAHCLHGCVATKRTFPKERWTQRSLGIQPVPQFAKITSPGAVPGSPKRTVAFRVTRLAHADPCVNLPGCPQTMHAPDLRWPSIPHGGRPAHLRSRCVYTRRRFARLDPPELIVSWKITESGLASLSSCL